MSTALSQILGTWTNAYGSQMVLNGGPSGILSGSYASTAGSSGTFDVFGYVDATAPAVTQGGTGAAISMVINWRDTGGSVDPTSNYVSGMSGQLICNHAGDPTMQFNHALIVTNKDGAYVPGFYVDRLEYDQVNVGAESPEDAVQLPTAFAGPTRKWVDDRDPTMSIEFQWPWDATLFLAFLKIGSQSYAGMMTTNTKYDPALSPYRGLAFTALAPAGQAISLSGWIDTRDNSLMFQEYLTTPQTWPARFFQSRGRTIYMSET